MHARTLFCALAIAVAGAIPLATPASAQSDILLQLRSGSPAGDRFRVDSAGGFVAMGTLGIGIIPASGEGYRTMWYPFKSAFRSGGSGAAGAWDDANLGFYSWGGGFGTRARGIYSFAMGNSSIADAQSSVAIGNNAVVHGTSPDFGTGGVSIGISTEVFKTGGVAIGNNATAGVTGTPTGGGGTGAVAIGHQVSALADNSLALGNRVSTGSFFGAMVFGDRSVTSGSPQVIATANNQFAVRAAGGYRLYSNSSLTAGIFMNAGGSTWSAISDRNRKENFAEVDGEDILLRLRGVPVSSWNYIAEGRLVRHIGPMAQDWHAAFRLNDDPLMINQGDFDGVNLAAIQALERRTAALQQQLAQRDEVIERLQQDMATVLEELRRLRSQAP
jgi:trimeric autotransporter adhesin